MFHLLGSPMVSSISYETVLAPFEAPFAIDMSNFVLSHPHPPPFILSTSYARIVTTVVFPSNFWPNQLVHVTPPLQEANSHLFPIKSHILKLFNQPTPNTMSKSPGFKT